MQKFSAWSLLRQAFGGHRGWQPQWRRAAPRNAYDAIVIGGGGHGLGTAYYLAAEHGLSRVAVLEKGWIGGGNTGRNTTVIRSNYLFDESARLYDHAVKMWRDLSQVLNYNVMYSPRGVLMLAHSVHDMQVSKRHIHANRCNGVDNEGLSPAECKAFCPPLNIGQDIRQSDKGELVIGAGTDAYTSYTQRGALHVNMQTLAAICQLFPAFRRLRMLRNWGGIVDVSPDRSPIIGKTSVPGLFINCGWGTGGFKATPGSAHLFAWTMAHDQPHPINAPFTLERFREGLLIDEAAAAAVAH